MIKESNSIDSKNNIVYYTNNNSTEENKKKEGNLNLRIMDDLDKNDEYFYNYVQNVDSEEKDKVNLDDLKTHKFKESVRHYLKEQLSNSFKMDDFFTKSDNKINFMYDNYHVPNMRNKLHVKNNDYKVKKSFMNRILSRLNLKSWIS